MQATDVAHERSRTGQVGKILSLEKAMRVLEVFGEARPEVGLTEIASAVRLDRSAVQRILNTFHQLGYLEKDVATRRFRPSLRMSELANAYLWADELVRVAMPKLIELRQTLGETINFSRLDGSDIVYVVRLPNVRTNYAAMIIGRRVPALNTASGRAMVGLRPKEERARCVEEWPMRRFTPETEMDRARVLASVETAARKRFCITRNELMMNEIGVAVAIRARDGGFGALHCSVTPTDWTDEAVTDRIVPRLQDAANAIG
ncbi:IclR family transcriptional regulator [Aureimonas mangrovi]|uniref:IclR family transcriptional regulator n=1 Tax=Aureimonas mangrovi TaxID=2758041 RepID=UPI00163D958E|nr:IclR family transcriptional regulator [Aureimonas mangrovi]